MVGLTMGNAVTSRDAWEEKINALKKIVEEYDALAREFITKVDTGRARSKRTYSEFKRILNREDI